MRLSRTLLACLLLVATAAPGGAEIFEGRFVFNKRCGTCHQDNDLMPRLMAMPNDKERGAFLESFLSRHHARDKAERQLIIDYLLQHQPRPASK